MIRQIHTFGGNDWLVARILDGFEGEDWWARPQGMNSAIWLLGHLHMERKQLGRILGGDFPEDERDGLFGSGTDPEDLPRDLDVPALRTAWHETHARFVDHLESLDAAALEAPIEGQIPFGPPTRLGALQFMLFHETYHVGQLGAIRKMLGKPSWMRG